MTDDQAVGVALGRLVDEGVLTASQRDAVVAALARERARPTAGRLAAEIAAYAGAGLLLSGVVLLTDSGWEHVNRLWRVLALSFVTALLVLGGVALAGPKQLFAERIPARTPRNRLAAALFALAALSVAEMVGVAEGDGSWVWPILLAAVVAVAGYWALPSLVGLVAAVSFGTWAVGGMFDAWAHAPSFVVGIAVLVMGGIWLGLTRIGLAVPTWAGYAGGIIVGVIGAELTDHDWLWVAALILLVAAASFALYVTDRSPVLLIGGGASLALAVIRAVWYWTGHSTGAAAVIILIGVVLLGIAGRRLIGDHS
ncbi:DUF2157 domain-containing protein [Nocardia sp. CDC153]|uniref:DUF2157 domain-containing protein n=1 Tax=Nocardia sp. CDC153 TaxID=3112167 RepID=UPI002DB5FBA9|nr:DUF2157 domain-containing protein [Nocardia sp. CDC153]MEC3955919.1 DUF2157 domain-containing protein [Nocardia sp. CDC153]